LRATGDVALSSAALASRALLAAPHPHGGEQQRIRKSRGGDM